MKRRTLNTSDVTLARQHLPRVLSVKLDGCSPNLDLLDALDLIDDVANRGLVAIAVLMLAAVSFLVGAWSACDQLQPAAERLIQPYVGVAINFFLNMI